MKLVLILVLLILAVMIVVGTLLDNRVSSYFLDDFRSQMEEVFTQRFLSELNQACSQEEAPVQLREMVAAYSGLLGIDAKYYTPEFLESYGCANYLKAGCVFADRINTVSPSYAQEIRGAEYSEGLDGILNARAAQLSGILNGIDTHVFDPETDKTLPKNFTKDDLSGKSECKRALMGELGLQYDPDRPVIASISRLA